MTTETVITCNRCNRRIDPADIWLSLTISASEDGLLRAPENRIDLCHVCEADMVQFMAGEVFHKFLEKTDPMHPDNRGFDGPTGAE